MKVNQAQIQEWIESPVTEEVRNLVSQHVEELRMAKGIDVYHPFDPQRTQETYAGLNGAIDSWEDVLDVLEGDWQSIEEVKDDNSEIETEVE